MRSVLVLASCGPAAAIGLRARKNTIESACFSIHQSRIQPVPGEPGPTAYLERSCRLRDEHMLATLVDLEHRSSGEGSLHGLLYRSHAATELAVHVHGTGTILR